MKKNVLLTIVLAMFAWTGMVAVTDAGVFISQNCDPASNYNPDRFAELYNPTDADVDLTGWTLENVQGGAVQFIWTLSGSITSGAAMVCGNVDVTDQTIAPDFTAAWSGNSFNGKGGDGTILRNAAGDTVDFAVQDDATGKFENTQMVRIASIVAPSKTYVATEWVFGSKGDVATASDANATVGTHVCDLPVSATPSPKVEDVMPESGSVFIIDEQFIVSANVTTLDIAGIDSVCLVYGDAYASLTDTAKMTLSDDLYSITMDMGDVGSKYGKVVAYGSNGEMTESFTIEVIAQDFKVFDMEKALYQVIVDSVNARGKNTNYSPETAESFYGANAKYNNFSAGDGAYDSVSFATSDAAIEEALSTILLPAVRSNAVVGDTFVIDYKLYQGVGDAGTMTFVCTATAPLAFEALMPSLTAFTMDSMDYQVIVNYTIAEGLNTKTSDSLISENYYGASAKYDNFDARWGKYDTLVFVTYDAAIEAALSTALLPAKMDQYIVGDSIEVNYVMYGGATNDGMMLFKYTSNGFERLMVEVEVDLSIVDMVKADYQIIVDSVNARGINSHKYPDNSENYFGFSAYFSNFDLGDDSHDSIAFSSTDAAAEMAFRTILLPALRPDAAVEDTFTVLYIERDDSNADANMEFVCTSTDPLTFEYTGELPAAVRNVEAFEFAVYPNPASSSIQLTKAVERVQFMNLSGRTLITVDNVEAKTSLDVSSLASGIYFVKVSANGKTGVSKLIKQ